MKAITRRIAILEAKLRPTKNNSQWRGIPTTELIQEMTREERNLLRESLLGLPNLQPKNPEYRRLELQGAAVFDAAHARISNNRKF